MSEKRFVIDEEGISDNKTDKWYCWKEEVVDLLNEQQASIEEYKDFCLNLCKFLIQKDFVDEYREKYGKEYKIITKWW